MHTLIEIRDLWLICLGGEQKFSRKPNGVLLGLRKSLVVVQSSALVHEV